MGAPFICIVFSIISKVK